MSDVDFYRQLFETGVASFLARPHPKEKPDKATAELLRVRFAQHRADVAGPVIDFDIESAWSAAQFSALACWFLVSRNEPTEELSRMLTKLKAPRSAAAHLATDLSLRFVLVVYKRAGVLNSEDALTRILGETLRDCPLTGVMAEKLEAPTGDLELGGHPGLRMLYAERLSNHFKAEWIPAPGPTRETAEWVFQQAGKPWKH